jgi:hypothetical protein
MPGPRGSQTSKAYPIPVGHNGRMADDEIERLLREIDASKPGVSAQPPARPASADPARQEAAAKSGGRLAFAGLAAAVMGGGAFVFAIFTPWTDAFDMGLAGAVAAFLTGFVAGPPRWFSS